MDPEELSCDLLVPLFPGVNGGCLCDGEHEAEVSELSIGLAEGGAEKVLTLYSWGASLFMRASSSHLCQSMVV